MERLKGRPLFAFDTIPRAVAVFAMGFVPFARVHAAPTRLTPKSSWATANSGEVRKPWKEITSTPGPNARNDRGANRADAAAGAQTCTGMGEHQCGAISLRPRFNFAPGLSSAECHD